MSLSGTTNDLAIENTRTMTRIVIDTSPRGGSIRPGPYEEPKVLPRDDDETRRLDTSDAFIQWISILVDAVALLLVQGHAIATFASGYSTECLNLIAPVSCICSLPSFFKSGVIDGITKTAKFSVNGYGWIS